MHCTQRWLVLGVLAAGVLAAVSGFAAERALPTFTDVTAKAGIEFHHSWGDPELSTILEATGPGCAFLDFDGDGNLDIYLINGAAVAGVSDPFPEGEAPAVPPRNRLYRNNGDGTFSDVTESSGTGDERYGMGAVTGDYDDDGDVDLFVANYGPNRLYRNNGDGTFTDVAEAAGVVGPQQLKGFTKWSLHGTFFDYDGDGWLDLYVANYLAFDPEYRYFFGPEGLPGPLSYDGQPDILYRNNGDGTFTDVTKEAGVFSSNGRTMSVGAADYDSDGDLDVFASNDAMENHLFRNNGDGTFSEVALRQGVAFGEFGEATSSMAPAFADLDNDLDLDLFVPDMGYSSLYRNDGEMFLDVSARSGLAEVAGQYTSWAPIIIDIDNDGLQDLFVTNGDAHHLYAEEDMLLLNRGGMRFEDVALECGEYFREAEYVGRGAASGDWDNDGDMDVLVANLGGPAILLRNDWQGDNHWLKLRLRGTVSPSDGRGARVLVRAGEQQWMQEVGATSGYLSSNDPRLHFGLGANATVDRLEVRWPSGTVQVLEKVAVDQILTVTEVATPALPEPEKPAETAPAEPAAGEGR